MSLSSSAFSARADAASSAGLAYDGRSLDALRQAPCQGVAARANTYKHQVIGAFIGLKNFKSNTCQSATDLIVVKDSTPNIGRIMRATASGYTCPVHSRLLPRLTGRI